MPSCSRSTTSASRRVRERACPFPGTRAPTAAHLLDQRRHRRPWDHRLARQPGIDRAGKSLGIERLRDVAARARPQRGEEPVGLESRRDHHHRRPRRALAHAPHREHAAAREVHVEEAEGRTRPLGRGRHGRRVFGFRHDLEALSRQHRTKRSPHQ
jgi:hypothetical protein